MTLAEPVLLRQVLKDPQNLGPFSSATVGMATEPGEHTGVIDQRGPDCQINGTLLQLRLHPPPLLLVRCARLRSGLCETQKRVKESGKGSAQYYSMCFANRSVSNKDTAEPDVESAVTAERDLCRHHMKSSAKI